MENHFLDVAHAELWPCPGSPRPAGRVSPPLPPPPSRAAAPPESSGSSPRPSPRPALGPRCMSRPNPATDRSRSPSTSQHGLLFLSPLPLPEFRPLSLSARPGSLSSWSSSTVLPTPPIKHGNGGTRLPSSAQQPPHGRLARPAPAQRLLPCRPLAAQRPPPPTPGSPHRIFQDPAQVLPPLKNLLQHPTPRIFMPSEAHPPSVLQEHPRPCCKVASLWLRHQSTHSILTGREGSGVWEQCL